MSLVPSVLVSRLSSALVVGFSGSRSVSPPFGVFSSLVACVPCGSVVAVGCAAGFDASVRSAFPFASVFRVSASFRGRGAFAVRSVSLVRFVAGSPRSVFVVFPAAGCPSGLVPSVSSSRCFGGFGSGSWASASFAVGLGVPCAVFVGVGAVVPRGWSGGVVVGGWLLFGF